MTELKTLKDLKADVPVSQIEDVDSFLLKAEAVKWVKKLRNNCDYSGADVLIDFFNINIEEDLKEEKQN